MIQDTDPLFHLPPAHHTCLLCMQRAALMWMLQREHARGPLSRHPTVHAFQAADVEAGAAACFGDGPTSRGGSSVGGSGSGGAGGGTAGRGPFQPGLPFFVDTATGEFSTEAPAALLSFLGGLYFDEPGLGKTITAVSGAGWAIWVVSLGGSE